MITHPDHQAFGFYETRYDPYTHQPIGTLVHRGLTKREYFAAMAMQGLLASGQDLNATAVAASAVEQADKLIKWLNPGGEV